MRWLVRLYPRAWRDRYEDEFMALLEQHPNSLSVILDVLLGAVDAHLHQDIVVGRMLPMNNAGRTKVITIFSAYIFFVVAGMMFYGMVDDSPFIPVMRKDAGLSTAWTVVAAGSAIALAAVVIGGYPIAMAVLKRVLSGERKDLLLLSVPVIAFGALVVYMALMVAIVEGWLQYPGLETIGGKPQPLTNPTLAGIRLAIFLIGAVASTIAVSTVIAHTDGTEQTIQMRGITIIIQPYKFALVPAVVAALAMGLMLAGTVLWGLIASGTLPQEFSSNFITWLVIVAMMAISTIVAFAAIIRGFSDRAAAQA